MITEIDNALLNYEKTVAVASEEGVDVATKEVRYEWTYVQSVFFSSTIITTVGERRLRCRKPFFIVSPILDGFEWLFRLHQEQL